MSNSSRRAVNFCRLCRGPLLPDGNGRCITPKCENYHRNRPISQRPTDASSLEVPIPVDIETEPEQAPPTDRAFIPTKDLPPERKAIRDYLAIPPSRRPQWPNGEHCTDAECGSRLQPDFLYCPYCGSKRELPQMVKDAASAYRKALTKQSIPSMPVPAIPPPPPSGSLPPNASPSRQSSRGLHRPIVPRGEEEAGASYSLLDVREERVNLSPPPRGRKSPTGR